MQFKPPVTQELPLAIPFMATAPATTLDANGIQLYDWSHPLQDHDDCCDGASQSRYVCCGCFALAQIESRMGIASFGPALVFYVLSMGVTVVLGFLTVWYFVYWGDWDAETISISSAGVLVVILAIVAWWHYRVATVRTKVRERFQIPGSKQEDRSVAFWQSTRMMRQLVRHLKCEDAGTFGRVDTLPAYSH